MSRFLMSLIMVRIIKEEGEGEEAEEVMIIGEDLIREEDKTIGGIIIMVIGGRTRIIVIKRNNIVHNKHFKQSHNRLNKTNFRTLGIKHNLKEPIIETSFNKDKLMHIQRIK